MQRLQRKITAKIKGTRTIDGAGVHLVRVLANNTASIFDPILMLDSFDTDDYELYKAGFPMHPHRGIETISYVYKGNMQHADSLGNSDTVTSGGVQWMTAGSGIMHEERIPKSERLLGVQLWLNLPQKDKMTNPKYFNIKSETIPEVALDDGYLRVLAGSYGDVKGFNPPHLSFDYYDVHIKAKGRVQIEVAPERSVMIFTLKSGVKIGDEIVDEKTAAKLSSGTSIRIQALDDDAQVLIMSSVHLGEPIAWGGPIVMNTKDELNAAFKELNDGTFIKDKLKI